jgi:hypothetical protein
MAAAVAGGSLRCSFPLQAVAPRSRSGLGRAHATHRARADARRRHGDGAACRGHRPRGRQARQGPKRGKAPAGLWPTGAWLVLPNLRAGRRRRVGALGQALARTLQERGDLRGERPRPGGLARAGGADVALERRRGAPGEL